MEKTVNFNLTEYADCVPVPSAILGIRSIREPELGYFQAYVNGLLDGMRSVKQKTESENKGA